MANIKENKRLEILNYLYYTILDNQYAPSVREIAQHVNLASTSTVHSHLKKLETDGFITKEGNKTRAIRVTDLGKERLDIKEDAIPVIGEIVAGEPAYTFDQSVSDYFPIPPHLEHLKNELFILEVKGNSMINAHICPGDYVFVKSQTNAQNGDIVVALTEENEATLKRFYKKQDKIYLHPENDTMPDIQVDNVNILGKVISLYRPMI